jgi:hypothetical protein
VTVAAVNGVATFSNLSINKAGTGYTLTATDGSLASGTSGSFNVTPATLTQTVSGTPSTVSAIAGETFSVGVQYATSNSDESWTGLGLRIHYDSSVLTFDGLGNVLQTSLIQQSQPMPDTANYDQDPSTDEYVLVSWADMNGNWPDQAMPVSLLTANFTLAPGVAAGTQTSIRFRKTPPIAARRD